MRRLLHTSVKAHILALEIALLIVYLGLASTQPRADGGRLPVSLAGQDVYE